MKKETTLISMQFPKELLEEIKRRAEELNISMSSYIRLKLTEEIRRVEEIRKIK